MAKILYIGGYGRSGSTILALLLACSENVFSVGEVGAIHRAFREKRSCTCGEALSDCPFWGEVVQRKPDQPSEDLSKRSVDVRVAINHAFQKSDADVLVDSTKTSYRNAFRPLKLHRAGYQVYFVHLVRDIGDVIRSSLKGRNSTIESEHSRQEHFVRSRVLLSWTIANLAAMTYRLVPKIKYIPLDYEELVRDPIRAINRIEELTGVDFESARGAVEKKVVLHSGHEINGNRLLREKGVIFNQRAQS